MPIGAHSLLVLLDTMSSAEWSNLVAEEEEERQATAARSAKGMTAEEEAEERELEIRRAHEQKAQVKSKRNHV